MSWSSASVGFWPRERITVPSSFVVMVPSPSLSNREKASLNSAKQKDKEADNSSRTSHTHCSQEHAGVNEKKKAHKHEHINSLPAICSSVSWSACQTITDQWHVITYRALARNYHIEILTYHFDDEGGRKRRASTNSKKTM